jgi:hypothetical protein
VRHTYSKDLGFVTLPRLAIPYGRSEEANNSVIITPQRYSTGHKNAEKKRGKEIVPDY